MAITLLLGGARSGKSARAETLAKALNMPVCYVATAPYISGDRSWSARIAKHQMQRPSDWHVVEEPLNLTDLLNEKKFVHQVLLIDCLTLWLSNLMFAEQDIEAEKQRFCEALKHYSGEVILVSNEVGFGLVPDNALGRNFRDEQGRLNQAVANIADSAELIVAGLHLKLK